MDNNYNWRENVLKIVREAVPVMVSALLFGLVCCGLFCVFGDLYLKVKIDVWLFIFLLICVLVCFIFPVLSNYYPYYNLLTLSIVILISFFIYLFSLKLFETKFFQQSVNQPKNNSNETVKNQSKNNSLVQLSAVSEPAKKSLHNH